MSKHVFVAGATGYLGAHIVQEYASRGWTVTALVRDAAKAKVHGLAAHAFVEAKATRRKELIGVMKGADVVVSALGLTRQKDGLTYRDVDYQANANLLEEALASGARRFVYVHVLNAPKLRGAAMVAAKEAFAERLRCAPIASTIVSPSGFFSDMAEFLDFAKQGKIWLFGDGSKRINPIDGADLAKAIADAAERGAPHAEIGGPDTYSYHELAGAVHRSLGQPLRIGYLPDWIRRLLIWALPKLTSLRIHGPVTFFLMASGIDMVAEPHGERRLEAFYREQAAQMTLPPPPVTGIGARPIKA